MKRKRNNEDISQITAVGNNNTAAIGGYDAYFGTYQVQPDNKTIIHTLEGSINPANIGLAVERQLEVTGNTLKIVLETTSFDGASIIRTLIWEKISS